MGPAATVYSIDPARPAEVRLIEPTEAREGQGARVALRLGEQLEDHLVLVLRRVHRGDLAAAEGHPAAVMDMSFANQALSVEYLARHHQALLKNVFAVPADIENAFQAELLRHAPALGHRRGL